MVKSEPESEPVKSVNKSKALPQGFPTPRDMRQYPTLAVMKEMGLPMNRETYLELAYLKPNPQIGPEEESELPEPFRRNL